MNARKFAPALVTLLVGMATYGYLCFYHEPPAPTYHLMPPGWAQLDTKGIDK